MQRHEGHERREGDLTGAGEMEPGAMMLEHPSHVAWVHPIVMLLGLWLASSPLMMPYDRPATIANDVVCGTLAVVFASLALRRRWAWLSYTNAFLGIWLLLAPLFFWTTSAAVYLNESLIGALLIAFSTLIPMGMNMEGAEVPRGWSYNPSSWPQRAPIAALALVGIVLARHMASFQLGHTSWTWEPFFGDGTHRVLTSDVSRMWPISDAGLGAATYSIELLSTLMGDRRRWRTMPWMVAMFGVVVVPLGVVSIVLIILQPLAVDAWCTPCLFSAGAMLVMIPLALDEVVAMIQLLVAQKRKGIGVWHTFWHGAKGDVADEESRADRRQCWRPAPMVWGVRVPWALALSTALGVWLMVAPAVLGTSGTFADSNHLVGALVIVVAVIAMAEVARPLRIVNAAFGAWLIAAPLLLNGASAIARGNTAVIGALLILLSVPSGRFVEAYGSYDHAARAPRLRRDHRAAGPRSPRYFSDAS
jgi:hypothetical protein